MLLHARIPLNQLLLQSAGETLEDDRGLVRDDTMHANDVRMIELRKDFSFLKQVFDPL